MSRRIAGCRCLVLMIVAVGLSIGCSVARAGEDPRTVSSFLQELKDHGLFDVAMDYINTLRDDPALPADLKESLDYEEGRILIDEASRSDLVRREELLRDARDKLDTFVKEHPKSPKSRDALGQIGKLLVERGSLALLLSEETTDKGKKDAKIAEARAAYSQAREVYGKAVAALGPVLEKYPVPSSMPKNDPRQKERADLETSYLNAQLEQGVCDHELAQTYPEGSPERTKLLDEAIKQFATLYNEHRQQYAGLAAQMWQAKCYEEKGELGPAIGIYKQLLEHGDTRLRSLQRFVGYFYIVALAKRKEYALAADQAVAWLNHFNRRDELLTKEGLGVQLELAKAIDAQMPNIKEENDQALAKRKIVEALNHVVRYASPFKKEALALLKKYRPRSAAKAEEISRLTYKEAIERAEETMATHEWPLAISLLKSAIDKAQAARDTDNLNRARYNLCFCYYMDKQYYASYVLADFLARRYPGNGLSPKATLIAMQSAYDAYNMYSDLDRQSDLDRIIEVARYTAETWPDRSEGDDARLNLGQIALRQGRYDKSIEWFGGIRQKSTRWLDAQTRLGGAHWAKSRVLDRRGNAKAATDEANKAIAILQNALKARRESGTAQTDPGFVGNVGDLAIVLTETGKSKEALDLVTPVIRAQSNRSGVGYTRLMEAQLRAFIGTNQVQQAIATMKTLEQVGGGASLTQLYLNLGKLLKRELDALEAKGDMVGYRQMHQSYRTFLTTLAGAKSGQTFESLLWAGESLLTLNAFADAENVLRRVLKDYGENPQFLKQKGADMSVFRARIKLAAALRGEKKFDEAGSIVEELLSKYPRYLDPQIEKGLLLEDEAKADPKPNKWSASLAYWQKMARMLERGRPRRVTYYDAWYHVAVALEHQGEKAKARRALMGIMRLTPSVGGEEMKAKYDALLKRLGRS